MNHAHTPQLCDTMMTMRHPVNNCSCDTYEGNLGPCLTWEPGANGNCAYCDHNWSCHKLVKSAVQGPWHDGDLFDHLLGPTSMSRVEVLKRHPPRLGERV